MRRVLSLAALSILALSAPASAQRSSGSSYSSSPSPEIGLDAGLTFRLTSPSATLIDIPVKMIRMGFFMSPSLSIEPTVGLTSASSSGASATFYTVGAGVLYHFSPNRAAKQFYVRPFLGVNGSSGGGNSTSDAFFGVGGGVKIPLRDRIASRFEANFAHENGNDFIGLLAGLSFYTR